MYLALAWGRPWLLVLANNLPLLPSRGEGHAYPGPMLVAPVPKRQCSRVTNGRNRGNDHNRSGHNFASGRALLFL